MKGSLAARVCDHLQVVLRLLADCRVLCGARECPHVPGVLPWLSSLRDRANRPPTLAGPCERSRVIQGAAQKLWVAWIGTLSATLLLATDAGAMWESIVRRRTPCISSKALAPVAKVRAAASASERKRAHAFAEAAEHACQVLSISSLKRPSCARAESLSGSGSACRCTTFHSPSSHRKTVVTRSA